VWRFYEPEESATLAILLSCTETDDDVTQSDADATSCRVSGSEHANSESGSSRHNDSASKHQIDSKVEVAKVLLNHLVQTNADNGTKNESCCERQMSSKRSANHNVLLQALSLSSKSDPDGGKNKDYGDVILVRSSASDSLAESFEELINDLQALIDKNNSPKPQNESETSSNRPRREDPIGTKLDVENENKTTDCQPMIVNVQPASILAEKTPLVSNNGRNFSFSSREGEQSEDSTANAKRVEETINKIKAVLEAAKGFPSIERRNVSKLDEQQKKKEMTVDTQAPKAEDNVKTKAVKVDAPPPTKAISFSPRSSQFPDDTPNASHQSEGQAYRDFTVTSSLTDDYDDEVSTSSSSSGGDESSLFSEDDDDIDIEDSDQSSVDSHSSRRRTTAAVPTEIFQFGSNSIIQSCSGSNSVLANVASHDMDDKNKDTTARTTNTTELTVKNSKSKDTKRAATYADVVADHDSTSNHPKIEQFALVKADLSLNAGTASSTGRVCPEGLTAIIMNPTILCRCTGPVNTCSPREGSFDDTGREHLLREGHDVLKYV
jgi:hypothetical protein